MMLPKIVVPAVGLDNTSPGVVASRTVSPKRLATREMGNLTCHEGEVEDLLSEGEST